MGLYIVELEGNPTPEKNGSPDEVCDGREVELFANLKEKVMNPPTIPTSTIAPVVGSITQLSMPISTCREQGRTTARFPSETGPEFMMSQTLCAATDTRQMSKLIKAKYRIAQGAHRWFLKQVEAGRIPYTQIGTRTLFCPPLVFKAIEHLIANPDNWTKAVSESRTEPVQHSAGQLLEKGM